jgi:hypothetical protein
VYAAAPVKRYTVSADRLLCLENVTLVPGEVYPEEEIHIIEVEAGGLFTSRLVFSVTAHLLTLISVLTIKQEQMRFKIRTLGKI